MCKRYHKFFDHTHTFFEESTQIAKTILRIESFLEQYHSANTLNIESKKFTSSKNF